MSVRLSCPSCNTAFALDAIPADRRAACPRCGDVFPVRGEAAEQANRDREAAGTPAAPLTPKHPTPNTQHQARSLRRAALVAVTLALGLAVGLAVYYSRSEKPKVGAPGAPPLDRMRPIDEVLGLDYLPAECNVVFGVRPGPVLTYAERTKQDPRELLASTGVPAPVFAALDQVGLPLTQIDHVAGGAFLGSDGDELRVAVALVLNQPLADEDAFLKKLKAKPVPGKKAFYTVEVGKLPLAPVIARVSPTVWVFGLSEKDFLQKRPEPHLDGLKFTNLALRSRLQSLPEGAAVWIMAEDDRDWTQKPLLKLLAGTPEVKKRLEAAGAFRGGTFLLRFGDKPYMRLWFRMADTASAERLVAYFKAQVGDNAAYLADAEARVDAPFDPALLQRFRADAAK